MAVSTHKIGDKQNATNHNQLHMPTAGQCNICGSELDDLRAVVLDGQFYQSVCGQCRGVGNLVPTDAKYNKARAQEDFAKEVLQPYVGGKVNPDFVTAYPERKEMFTAEELAEI